MNRSRISGFTMHDDSGHAILKKDWLSWVNKHGGPGDFGVTTSYSWYVDGSYIKVSVDISRVRWRELPDESGFICFESEFVENNCVVLDAYGVERYRLKVPLELTPYDVPPEAKRWFRGPSTHPDGKYGVIAWIEYAGDFYFELDYHEGRFLWGKEIRY